MLPAAVGRRDRPDALFSEKAVLGREKEMDCERTDIGRVVCSGTSASDASGFEGAAAAVAAPGPMGCPS